MCRTKNWIQMEVRLAKPDRPSCQPWLSSGTKIVTLDLNLICLRTCLLAILDRGLGPAFGLSTPEVRAACAQPGLLEHKHGLCAVLGRQVETMSEVVLSPQEGIEVIRNQQDL